MKRLLTIMCCFILAATKAQAPKTQLQRGSFESVTATMPPMLPEKFIDNTKAWAHTFTRTAGGYDATNVTGNTITISALKRNAFRYQNAGETVENKVGYSLEITFNTTSYTIKYIVNDIYGDNDTLLEYKLPDYFTSNGKLKEGYNGLIKSMEATANETLESFHDYITNR
ncbi:MAG: hypothetical protein V4581_02250 [Bacteroidota bacterium]